LVLGDVKIWIIIKIRFVLKVHILFLLACPFRQFLLTYANVCVFPVGFILVLLYCCFCWRAGAWGVVCVPVPCPCVSSCSACLLLSWRYNPVCSLGLLHGFVTVNFSGVRSLSPTPNPRLVRPGAPLRVSPTL
jgi:hypothetical protein